MPFIVTVIEQTVLSQLAHIARFVCFNQTFPAFVTSFPGPALEFRWHNKNKLLGGDYAVAGLIGNAGVGFTVLSVMNNLRIAVTAEEAIMNRREINQLVKAIENEFENLLLEHIFI